MRRSIGECELYSSSQLVTSSICSPFVPSQVFVPDTTTQAELDAKLFQSEAYQLLQKMTSIVPLNCYKSYSSFLCQSYFPSCNPGNTSIPFYPCHSSCSLVLDTCESSWSFLDVEPINCTDSDIIEDNSLETTICSSSIFPENAAGEFSIPVVSSCPSVYSMRHDPTNTEAICSIRCPDPGYTISEYGTIAKVNVTLAVVSIVLIIYVLGGYIMDFAKRKFPARLQIWLLLSILGFQIGTLMSGSDPEHTTMCVDSTTYSTQSNNSTCAAQGFFLIFFSLSAALWLLIQSGVTFFAIVLEKRPKLMAEYEKFYHAFVWVIASVFIIIIFATESIDFSYSTRIYCFISVKTWHGISIDYPLYYIPMTIIFGTIFVFFVGALIKLLFHGKQNKKLTASKTYTRAQLRILIVTALMIVLFAAIFGFRYTNSSDDAIERTANRSNWVKCKVKADILGYDYPRECNTEVNPERTSFGPKMFQNVGLAILGAWVFLGFGTDTSTFRQWVTLGKCIYKRDMSGFWRRLSISKSSAELISASSIKVRQSRSKKSSEQTSEQQSNELRSISLESSSEQLTDVKSNEPSSDLNESVE